VTVGAVSSEQGVVLSNSSGALTLGGTLGGTSVSLTADGFSGDEGTISAPQVLFTDDTPTDTWTLMPGSVEDGSSGVITLSTTSTLTVDGGQTFYVQPAASTIDYVDSSSNTSGTLYYLAGGRAVSEPPPTPSGTINAAGVDAVSYTGMGTVTVEGAAGSTGSSGGSGSSGSGSGGSGSGGSGSSGSGGGGGGTTFTPAPTICTLSLTNDKIQLPKLVHGKRRGKATLTASVRCSETERAVLSGSIAVVSKLHGKRKYRDYSLAAFRATAKAGVNTKITIDVPSAVEAAAGTKDKLSAAFTLGGSSGGHYVSLSTTMDVARLT
jgi:hypothetical protein